MSVTRREVDRIAGLARLELGHGEAESLREDLNGILKHMETLAEASVAGAGEGSGEPDEEIGEASPASEESASGEAHREGSAPLRGDGDATPDVLSLSPEELAPEWQDGFFSVPRLPGLEDEASP